MLVLLMIMFETGSSAQTSDAAIYVTTYIDVQASSTDQGISSIKQYREASRIERGIRASMYSRRSPGRTPSNPKT